MPCTPCERRRRKIAAAYQRLKASASGLFKSADHDRTATDEPAESADHGGEV